MKLAPSRATLNIGSNVLSKIGSPVWFVKSATSTLTGGCAAFGFGGYFRRSPIIPAMSNTASPADDHFQYGLTRGAGRKIVSPPAEGPSQISSCWAISRALANLFLGSISRAFTTMLLNACGRVGSRTTGGVTFSVMRFHNVARGVSE